MRSCDTLLIELLAIRLGEPTTLTKSLVMAEPADCGRRRWDGIPAPDACARRVMPSAPCHGRSWRPCVHCQWIRRGAKLLMLVGIKTLPPSPLSREGNAPP